jgi:hypothetical protein
VNKHEKINLQSGNIVRILDGFMAAGVPHDIAEVFKETSISPMLDKNRRLLCLIMSETTQCF